MWCKSVAATFAAAGLTLWVGSQCTRTPGPAEKLLDLYVRPVLGADAGCVTVTNGADGWINVVYTGSRTCEMHRRLNPVLDILALRGKWTFLFVEMGPHRMFGYDIDVGPAPRHSPAWTFCDTNDCQTVFLDPRQEYGSIPGDLMDDGRDSPIWMGDTLRLGRCFAHEIAHGLFRDKQLSDQEAVLIENWFLAAIAHLAVRRLRHDPPPREVVSR